MLTHDFKLELEYSLEKAEDSIFDLFYYRAFPNLLNIKFVDDLTVQKMGIDKILLFSSGNQVSIDEKKRKKDYNDILLEIWSVYEQRKPGWLWTSKSDYIVYAVMPTKKIYLLPTLLLKKAWLVNSDIWHKQYPRWIVSHTPSYDGTVYTTKSKAIPPSVLLPAISNEMEHSFIFSNGDSSRNT